MDNLIDKVVSRDHYVFLLLHGQRVHFTPYAHRVFEDQGIAVMSIPAHARDLYQVLDLCIFGVMKKEYKQLRNPGQ
jgi:hypothetical protein